MTLRGYAPRSIVQADRICQHCTSLFKNLAMGPFRRHEVQCQARSTDDRAYYIARHVWPRGGYREAFRKTPTDTPVIVEGRQRAFQSQSFSLNQRSPAQKIDDDLAKMDEYRLLQQNEIGNNFTQGRWM